MRWILSGLLLSVSPVALAQNNSAWEIDIPAASEAAGEVEFPGPNEVLDEAWSLHLAPTLSDLNPGEMLSVPMPGGAVFDGQVRQINETASGGQHIQISFPENGQGVLLHVGLNATYGRVWTGNGVFVIHPDAHGDLVLRRAPEEPVYEDGIADPIARLYPSSTANSEIESTQAGTDTLDFLYFYDIEMIETHGWGLPDLAATDIGNMQTALTISGVPLFTDLAQLQFMDVARDYPSDDLLTNAGNRDGVFTGLQDRIDSLGVDVVTLNRVYDSDRESFCGLGYVHDPTSDFTGRSHINVCHNGLTLAHETGHNMGLTHGVQTDGAGSGGRPVDWARGYRIDSANADGGIFTSVMAYGSNRTPQYSDPTFRCPERGSFCGVPIGQNGESYATEALRRYAVGFPAQGVPNRRLRSSVLPTSRFVTTDAAATAFMTVINPNQVEAVNCIIEHHGPNRDSFSYQRTDPNTNALVGSPDTPVNIPAGGFQTYLISLTPSDDVSGVRFAPYASCDNVPMAAVSPGLNTVDLGADTSGGPDIIALSATIGNNGIVDIPDGRRGVFSVATVNLGGAGDVTVSAQSLDSGLPATGQVCQTDGSGACMAPPADTLVLNIGENATPTFGVFVSTDYVTPFSASERFQFQLQVAGTIRGSTSVAVRDAGALVAPTATGHTVDVTAYGTASGALASYATGYFDRFEIVTQPTLGTVSLDASTGAYSYTASGVGGSDSFTYRVGNSAGWSAAMTASVNVGALPVPAVMAFAIPDDTSGTFQTDLDDHVDSNIEIDRFILTSPPTTAYTFDPLSGVINITLPSDPGAVTFDFTAENRSGQGNTATGQVDVIAYDICAPSNITRSRLQRRLEEIEVNTFGSVTMSEAETLGTTLCMTETQREGGQFIRFRNTSRGIQVLIALDDNEYDIYMANDGSATWEAIFPMCKTIGENRLTAC